MDLAQNFEALFSIASLVSLITLTILEIVLGIDNIIFISIVAGKLPKNKQGKARTIGLMLALIMRVGLLFSITWVIGLKEPLFAVFEFEATARDLILFAGGVFLLYKTTIEIHNKIEGGDEVIVDVTLKKAALRAAIFQIVLIDIVFSFDSILTAVGLVDNVLVMIIAVVIAIIVMMLFSGAVSNFVNNHPTVKMLALAFLLMIGILLIADAFHFHVPKGYVYFSMAFSLLVEGLNMRMRKKANMK